MFQGSPIPHDATVDDPVWTARFMDLANALILYGARGKLVAWATGLSKKLVTERYMRITGEQPPAGRCGIREAKSFTIRSHHSGYAYNVQCALFASCYIKLQQALREPVHKAWLLYTAYDCYVRLTPKSGIRAETIPLNHAYDIVTCTQFKHPQLKLHPCPDCGIPYLILTSAEIDNQNCPICAMGQHCDRLIQIGTEIGTEKSRKLSKTTITPSKAVVSGT